MIENLESCIRVSSVIVSLVCLPIYKLQIKELHCTYNPKVIVFGDLPIPVIAVIITCQMSPLKTLIHDCTALKI